MHPTLSKTSTRAPRSYRLTQGLSKRPHASRRWPRFGRLTRHGSDALDVRIHASELRPLTSVSPADFPDGEAGSTFQPMPLSLPPRERRLFPRHRTPSASKEPFSGPSSSPGRCHPGSLSRRLFTFGCRFSRAYCLGLSPRGLHQPQPTELAWTWRRLMTSATTRKAGHTGRTSEPHAKLHFWVLAFSKAPKSFESRERLG
jgi:hypothetical protein